MRETWNELGSPGEIPDSNTLTAGHPYMGAIDTGQYDLLDMKLQQDEYGSKSIGSNQDSISGVFLPPNEASEQDKWPFQ